MAQDNPPARPPAAKALQAQVEMVADHLSGGVIHGWHSNRLLRFQGVLYASATVEAPNADNLWKTEADFYRREADGKWVPVAHFPQQAYSMMVGPDGTFWTVAPANYDDARVYRTQRPLDLGSFELVFNGTCGYAGASISPEGNFLILYAESSQMTAFVPNAVHSAFYDRATGQWHKGRMVTPEGRYGYEGVLLRGRKALAVLNSAIYDDKANPVAPHYSWRHVRLARCDDLTKGEWAMKPWLMPDFGATALQDFMVGPDGEAYLSYSYAEGTTYEEYSKKPTLHYIARIHDDLSVEVFPTGLNVGATRLLVDSAGGWHMVGATGGGNLRLWDLDPANGFRPGQEYELLGTEKMTGYVIHTLRPQRFGGETDGDTIHLLTAGYVKDAEGKDYAQLWHAAFRLPLAPE